MMVQFGVLVQRPCSVLLVFVVVIVCSAFANPPSAESDVAPAFITRPSNKTVKNGMNTNFKCKATGFPPPEIKWYKRGVRIGPFAMRHFIGVVFKTLYIMPVYWSDAGQITCKASNRVGTISANAYLRVVTKTVPIWITRPQDVTLYKGQQFTIKCQADGFPDPVYTWSKGIRFADSDPTVLSMSYGDLVLISASFKNSGEYTCAASNSAGSISKKISVNVLEDPSVVRDPKDTVGVVSQTLSLQCTVIGKPPTSVSWRKDGQALDFLADSRKSVSVKTVDSTLRLHTLKIEQGKSSDAGQYRCVITNKKGSTSSKIAVVSFADAADPPTVSYQSHMNIAEGSEVTLKCVFTGTPLPQVTWFRYIATVALQLKQSNLIPLSNITVEASLQINSVSQTDGGLYVCKGTNAAGTATGNITLVVPADSRKPEGIVVQQEVHALRGNNVTLVCKFTGNPQPEITWYRDGNELADELGHIIPGSNNTYSTLLGLAYVQYRDAGQYLCLGQNPYGKAEMTVNLTLKGKPMPPTDLSATTISTTRMSVSWTPGVDGGAPVFYTIEYRHNESSSWTEVEAERNTSTVLDNEDGWYMIWIRVRATNIYGSSKPSATYYLSGREIIKVKAPGGSGHSSGVAVLGGAVGGGALLFVLVLLVLLILWRKRTTKKKMARHLRPTPSVLYTRSNMEEEELIDNSGQGQPQAQAYAYVPVSGDCVQVRQPEAQENDYETLGNQTDLEVPKRCLTLSKQLGSGHFGKVMKAFMKTKGGVKTVAVKMLKEKADPYHKKEFIAELELMKSLKPHPNIVGLVGSCTKGDEPYIIVEFCSLGNLRDFLRKSQGNRVYSNLAGGSSSLTSGDLLSFMWQVARGMAYFASLKLVHRDLAARNILVDAGNICKIADFGLARDIYEENQYLKTTEGELPLRWMALESIFKGITTIESDVWSFGILMWEIITLGANPYPGFTREQLISNLHLGYRMPRPPYCNEELYSVIWQCWKQEPSERPTFSMLCRTLNRMLTAQKVLIDLANFDAEYVNAKRESGEPVSP